MTNISQNNSKENILCLGCIIGLSDMVIEVGGVKDTTLSSVKNNYVLTTPIIVSSW